MKDKLQRYDTDEPFWTSKGRIVRADGDGQGDNGTNGGFHQDEGPYYHYVGCGTESYGNPGYVFTRYCQVWLNYSVRMLKQHMVYKGGTAAPTAIKIEEAGKVGLVADTLEMERGSWRPWAVGLTDQQVLASDYVQKAQNIQVTNHDNSYNVLFADGAVKTYADGAKNVLRAWVVVMNHKANENWRYTHNLYNAAKGTTEKDGYIWTPFLDNAYAQD